MDALTELSKLLKYDRETQHLSQADYAQELGVAKATLQKLERRETVSMKTSQHVADHFGMELSIGPKAQPRSCAPADKLIGELVEEFDLHHIPNDNRRSLAALLRAMADHLEEESR